MNPLFHTEFSISDSLKNVRKSVLIYETIIKWSLLKLHLAYFYEYVEMYFEEKSVETKAFYLPAR